MTDGSHHVTLRCRCNAFAITAAGVRPAVAGRLVCHCEGCVAFAKRMDPRALDAYGGMERFNVSPGCLTFSEGAEHLACLRQTPKGSLRWVASCCDTPLGLTLRSPRVPFVGLDVGRIDEAALDAPLDVVIGPLRARVNGDFRGAEAKALKADTASLVSMLAHLAPLTLGWWWRGEQRRSPFFESGAPVVEVRTLYSELPVRRVAAGCR